MTRTRYEFRVNGEFSPQTREALLDMCVQEYPAGALLRGDVIDESHLLGIIAALRAMDLVVVAANPVSPGPAWAGEF
jgi:hypothetical protein